MTSRFSLLLALLLPALLVPTAAFAAKPAPAPLVAGTDYELIEGGAPFDPVDGKIEVAEVFGYTCPHCAHFEPALEAWRAKLPKDVKFIAVAAPWGSYWTPYAKAYYAAKTLGVADRSHEAVFHALHEEGSLPRNPSDDEIASFYVQYGVQPARFLATFNGAAVEALMQRADAFIRRSGVEGTPTLVVAGKYRVLTSSRTPADTLRIVDQLVARERTAGKR